MKKRYLFIATVCAITSFFFIKHLLRDKTIFEDRYDAAEPFHYGSARVTKDGETYFINRFNQRVRGHGYDEVIENQDLHYVRKGNKWGVVSRFNTKVTEIEYDKIYLKNYNTTIVTKNNKIGIITRYGEFILPCIADEIIGFGPSSYTYRVDSNIKTISEFRGAESSLKLSNENKENIIIASTDLVYEKIMHDNQWGVQCIYDKNDTIETTWICPPLYQEIIASYSKFYVIKLKNKVGLIACNHSKQDYNIANQTISAPVVRTIVSPIYQEIIYCIDAENRKLYAIACKKFPTKQLNTKELWTIFIAKKTEQEQDFIFQPIKGKLYTDVKITDGNQKLFVKDEEGWSLISTEHPDLINAHWEEFKSLSPSPKKEYIFDFQEFSRRAPTIVKQNGKWKRLTGTRYWDEIKLFNKNRNSNFLVKKEALWGVMDRWDKIIIDPEWDEIKGPHPYIGRKGDKWQYVEVKSTL